MTALEMTERELQDAVLELARLTGWLVYHTHDSRYSAAGFPDLVLVRDGRLMWVELKRATGRVAPAQLQWIAALQAAGQDVQIWRPADWASGSIEAALARRRPPG